MNLPNELIHLIEEKWLIDRFSGAHFHQLPTQLVTIASKKIHLLEKYNYSSDTIRWLIRCENIPVLNWVYKNRKYWNNLPQDVIILGIVTHKQLAVEWADTVLDPRLKEDILYTFKAVTAKNDKALDFLRRHGYRWSDDLLHLEENV